ncbi:MAG: bifunctional adenosylcobinamide kinase/adenosylcobinamide-phosphate guanylyltransferase [Nitrospira sp.]|nr:bifunctional adenosylcobinamide kinase/adenosylcobinamide-phosphate guanylyltransferase [Nitrospira sp.]
MNAGNGSSHLCFVLGGARSGKSRLALTLAGNALPRAFVATAEPGDEEMAARIRQHREDRDPTWETQEIPIDVSGWLKSKGVLYKTVVIDCLTLWLANLLGSGIQESKVLSSIDELMQSARTVPGSVVLVSNEVGLGIVPGDAVTRQFRDLAGAMNQRVAAASDAVYLSVSGLPMQLK